jgi:hypothetical protein
VRVNVCAPRCGAITAAARKTKVLRFAGVHMCHR